MIIREIVKLPFDREYFIALLSGSESGLATTSAIAAGLLMTAASATIVITTATISFIVQAFNSAISKFSAEHTSDELDYEDVIQGYKKPAVVAILQFASHAAMGIIVLLPIIYMSDKVIAMSLTIALTLTLLFLLGAYKGYVVGKKPLPEGMEQVSLGALIIGAGIVAGYLLS